MVPSSKIRIEQILTQVESYLPSLDEDLLRHAYIYAANRHQGQVRRSGEDYFIHPLTVAWILAEMELDEVAIAAGLLHDIIEDTDTTAEEMELEFGPDVTRLVVALTKISTYESSFSGRQATEAENFRRLLLASVNDVRVIIIKLADRLHNMRTLEFLSSDRQMAIAQETLDINAPIANRLGIGSIKGEMEDLCFQYLQPAEAERLQQEIGERAVAAERWFSEIQTFITVMLSENGIDGTIRGRVKHHYSIFQKLERQGIDVSNVFDFLAFRIIVNSVSECYATLGLIHQRWSPVHGRIKDHIAIPKPNAYQSLHTTVIGPEGHPFEIQIRTWGMHKIAEFGIAAHWSYKEQGSESMADDSRISWLRGLLDNVEDSTPGEFLDSLKIDLYPDEVYSFTPRGDVFSFPRGATILDFAYRVHTEVGQTCVGGRVNGRWVSFKTELTNGDIVEITTAPHQTPHHDWLNLVVTTRARSKIRSYLKREEKVRAVDVGKKLLERELRRGGVTLRKFLASKCLTNILSSAGMSKEDDLLAAVGFGKVAPARIAHQYQQETHDGAPAVEETPEPVIQSVPSAPKSGDAVEVRGDADFMVYLAKCCDPLPGEDIVGYVTRGKGVAVHARTCPNVRNLLYHPEREIDVRWASSAGKSLGPTSKIDIDLLFSDRQGMLASISQVISAEGSDILSCQLRSDDDEGFGALTIEVKNSEQLKKILRNLKTLKGMRQVERRGHSRGLRLKRRTAGRK